MREPELWVRCPKALPRTDDYGWGCGCHGLGAKATLVRVPDGAAGRMADLYRQVFDSATDCEPWMADLLRAAVGGEGL